MKLVKEEYCSYLYIKQYFGKVTSKEIAPNIVADYDKDGNIVGIEIIDELEIEDNNEQEK